MLVGRRPHRLTAKPAHGVGGASATEYSSSTTSPQRPLGRASVMPKVGPAVEVGPVCQGSTLRSDPEEHHIYSRLTRQGRPGRTGPTTSEREGRAARYNSIWRGPVLRPPGQTRRTRSPRSPKEQLSQSAS